jgi:hypothetical protein
MLSSHERYSDGTAWTQMRWRRRWRRLHPLIVATVLTAIVVLILVLLAQYLNGPQVRFGLLSCHKASEIVPCRRLFR